MLRNYIVVAWRNLLRYKLYSLINVVGLAVGMTCCILMLLWVQDELSFDLFHEKADRIYRIVTENQARTAFPLGPQLQKDFPEIEQVVRLSDQWERLVRRGDRQFLERGFVYADPEIFRVFSFPFIKGDPHSALREPLSMIISEEIAAKYFGDADPIGQILTVENEYDYTVNGVMKKIPQHSHVHFDFLVTLVGAEEVLWDSFLSHWGSYNAYTYVLLTPGSDIRALGEKYSQAIVQPIKEKNPELGLPKLQLQPLPDIHLHSADLQLDIEPQGDIVFVYVFSAIAAFILLIACINFMNLSTARSAHRAREVGMRKVVGAFRSQLIRQFMGEAFFLAFLAFLFSMVMVEFALPVFNTFVEKELEIGYTGSIGLSFLGITLLVGIIAGSYPAFLLTAFDPVDVLKGVSRTGVRSVFIRRCLVVFQFALSIALIIGTAIVYSQLDFIHHKKLGFDKEHVLVAALPGGMGMGRTFELVHSELSQHPGIVNDSAASDVPPDRYFNTWTFKPQDGEGKDTWVIIISANYGLLETLDIELVAGRSFSREIAADSTEALILNETAVREIGWETAEMAIGREGELNGPKTIIGVVRDFHMESLHSSIRPMAFRLRPISAWLGVVRIRAGQIAETVGFLEGVWHQHAPKEIFNYRFVDEELNELYRTEEKLGQISRVFASLAIFVSCLGLFGLTSFTAEQRTKEIGIRKVLGASVSNIVGLLSKEMSWLVIAANAFAWPAVYFFTDRWLQNFAYRIELSPGVFLLGGVLALCVVLFTASTQALKIALSNPVEVLRYE